MKLLRYGPRGQEKPGMMDSDGTIRDLSAYVDDINGASISVDGLAKLAAIDPASLPAVDGDPRLGACVGDIGKFMCIGLNYTDHAEETGMPIPEEPILFAKFNSAICGPNDDIIVPRASTKLDWEVELGVVERGQDLCVTEQSKWHSVVELVPVPGFSLKASTGGGFSTNASASGARDFLQHAF